MPSRTIELAASHDVTTTTLDDYCNDAGVNRIDLLKIDVEGAEQRVLTGATRMFGEERIDVVLIEVSDNTLEAFGDASNRLLGFLESRGLRSYLLAGGRLRPFRVAGEQRNLLNVFALSDRARARIGERLA